MERVPRGSMPSMTPRMRQTWYSAALATGTVLVSVLLVVAGVREHERRVRGRDRRFSHIAEPV